MDLEEKPEPEPVIERPNNEPEEKMTEPKESYPRTIDMTKITNKFVNMSKFITKEFVKVFENMEVYAKYPK